MNLAPGEHGFQIHRKRNIVDGCAGAGGPFDPEGVIEGASTDKESHVGDLGTILADEDGHAEFTIQSKRFSLLDDNNNIIGRSIVVHADADD